MVVSEALARFCGGSIVVFGLGCPRHACRLRAVGERHGFPEDEGAVRELGRLR